jgi:hypothetical protein
MFNPILQYPNDVTRQLMPGHIVKLGRFDDISWVVNYGWYSCDDNRSVCGWYLVSKTPKPQIKPIHITDLDDIYIIET